MPKYLVKKYYSTFFEQEVEADNEEFAYGATLHFSEVEGAKEELINNLLTWAEGDEIEEIK